MEINQFDVPTVLRFFGWIIYAFTAFTVALLIPGKIIIGSIAQTRSIIIRFVMYTGAGMVLWIIQSFVLGYLNIRWATYVYLGLCAVVTVSKLRRSWKSVYVELVHYRISRVGILLFAVGIAGQIAQSVPSAFVFPKGWYTFIADDSLYHFGLTGALIRDIPPLQPGMSGTPLINYHYFANMFIGEFIRVFQFPHFLGQFLFGYGFFSFMLGALLYIFLRTVHISRLGAIIGVYLQYFASDIIYLTIFLSSSKWIWNVHPLEDGTMFLENPPRAFAMVLTLFGLCAFTFWEKYRKGIWAILAVVSFSLVIGAKVHNGLLIMMGAVGMAVFSLFKKKWPVLVVSGLTLAGSWTVYSFMYAKAGGPLWAPFEMARMFAVQPLVKLSFLELRRQIYMDHNNILRALQMDLTMLIIFLLSQFGIRNLAWFSIPYALKRFRSSLGPFFVSGLFGTMILATWFIQPLGPADIFNSYLAASVFLTILTAMFVDRFKLNKSILIIFSIAALVSTMPRWIYRMVDLSIRARASRPMIGRVEIDAGNFLARNTKPDEIILVFNTGHWDWTWSYVSALSDRYTYLSGQRILYNLRVDYSHREYVADTILKSRDADLIEKLLRDERIKYLYFYSDIKQPEIIKKLPLRQFYNKGGITVYEII